jgi:AcrR family transcriptional regulator
VDPRVARSRAKIFEAVLEELATVGYAAMTIEGVAGRAGVAKTTVYRHWESKARLVNDAVHDQKFAEDLIDTGNLREDLLGILGRLAARLEGGNPARILPAMISAAEVDPELAKLHQDFVQQRRRPLIAALERAIVRGELPADVDVEIAADMLSGPLFFRRFISRMPISSEFAQQLVGTLLPQLGGIHTTC